MKTLELKQKHSVIIEFMKQHDGIIDWVDDDITPKISMLISRAIPDVIQSYCETETYMLNDNFT
jgi:hypothetical protein